jgi:hypothetical protein
MGNSHPAVPFFGDELQLGPKWTVQARQFRVPPSKSSGTKIELFENRAVTADDWKRSANR